MKRAMPKKLIALALLSCGLAQAQSSEEQDLALVFGDSALVSIATGSAQPLRRAPAVAAVITAADIEAMGASDLDQVLERVPGLHVGRGSGSYTPLYVARGIYSQFNPQILMLQNGVPMTTLLVGNRGNGWGGLPLPHIARIEIMLSPGSALYGSDAYAGVINIITKGARDLKGGEAGLRLGAFGTREAWLQQAGRLGPAEFAAFVQRGHSDGARNVVEADAQSFNDSVFGSHASLAPGSLNNARDSWDANLDLALAAWRWRINYKLRELGTGAGISQALDPAGLYRTERLVSDLSWQQAALLPDLSAGFGLSALYYSQQFPRPLQIYPAGVRFPTGLFPDGMFGAPETWERQWRLHAFLGYEGLAQHKLRVGVGYEDLDMYRTRELKNFAFAANGLPIPLPAITDHSDIDPFMRPQRRSVAYAYLQDDWQLARDWTLTLGLRHDRYSDFGSTSNPRLALVWEAAYNLTAKLLYGQAFRAPAFNEQYSISNPVARGNPAIRPETLATREAQLIWQPGRNAQLSLAVYQHRLGDIIRTTPNALAGTGTTFNNTSDQRGHGLELSASWEASAGLHLQLSLSQQRSRDQSNGLSPGYAPRRHAYLLADWRLGEAWQLGAQLNRVAGRERAPGDARAPLADYSNLDLSLRHAPPGARWSVAATLRNATDSDQREPSQAPGRIVNDLPLPPRNLSVELNYRF
jgi:iron complex outermembrane receptor protein